MKVLGIDLGGTKVAMGVVDENGNISKKKVIDTKTEEGFESVTQRIAQAIKEINDKEIKMIGIGSPGSIDHENGVVRFSPNFPGWINVPLASAISSKVGLRVVVENDANAFAVGEKWFGVAKGYKNVLGLTLGTGVGGGIICDDKVFRGSTGIGAELGHVVVEPNGYLCGCGNHGCLETIASATGISRLAREWKERYPDTIIKEFSAKEVMDAAKKGDPLGVKVFERVTDALGIAIGSFVHIFNPEIIVIGGGVSRAGQFLLDGIEKKTHENVMRSFWGTYKIVLSNLVDDAGIYGAASMCFEELRNDKGITG
ncbi:ROK family protein [Athalassotoga saccharophila]|uniref:ROK family protein n=1 Tax=Athalassotoga saccharophila TaxID=1441386 RepID=UPI001379E3AA|nr:ROK family protein [Athalassotoga saccharophila]BBJ28836.1 glucokinase [Athalassotoga saccharophila]